MNPVAYISAAICACTMVVASWGITKLWITLVETVGRNPQVKKEVNSYGVLGSVLIEAIALYAFVVAVVILFSK